MEPMLSKPQSITYSDPSIYVKMHVNHWIGWGRGMGGGGGGVEQMLLIKN